MPRDRCRARIEGRVVERLVDLVVVRSGRPGIGFLHTREAWPPFPVRLSRFEHVGGSLCFLARSCGWRRGAAAWSGSEGCQRCGFFEALVVGFLGAGEGLVGRSGRGVVGALSASRPERAASTHAQRACRVRSVCAKRGTISSAAVRPVIARWSLSCTILKEAFRLVGTGVVIDRQGVEVPDLLTSRRGVDAYPAAEGSRRKNEGACIFRNGIRNAMKTCRNSRGPRPGGPQRRRPEKKVKA